MGMSICISCLSIFMFYFTIMEDEYVLNFLSWDQSWFPLLRLDPYENFSETRFQNLYSYDNKWIWGLPKVSDAIVLHNTFSHQSWQLFQSNFPFFSRVHFLFPSPASLPFLFSYVRFLLTIFFSGDCMPDRMQWS